MSNFKWCYVAHLPANLVTFTEELLNGKLHFLCSGYIKRSNILPQIGNNEPGLYFSQVIYFLSCVAAQRWFFSSGMGKLLFLGIMER